MDTPKLDIGSLLDLLEKIQWKDYYKFSYNRTKFLLLMVEDDQEGPQDEEIAEYFRSTMIDGWDIYVHETLPDNSRKRSLFHEILEANLRDQGYSRNDAHRITLEEENKVFGPRQTDSLYFQNAK